MCGLKVSLFFLWMAHTELPTFAENQTVAAYVFLFEGSPVAF